MNELPTEERCRELYMKLTKPGGNPAFVTEERSAAQEWGMLRGIDPLASDWYLASRLLSDHYGSPSTLPERDEATGTGPATQDRPADIWRDNPPGTVTQRDGKPEPKLELTAEERWHSQMNRSEVMITKQERLQHEEERLQIQREQQQDKFERILAQAEKVLVSFIAKIGGPATAADIERTQELAKGPAWEKIKAMIGTMPVKPETESAVPVGTGTVTDFPNIKRDRGFTQGGYTKEQEIKELRLIVEDQKVIMANLYKRIEDGRKRGQMVRDLLSKEL